MASYIDYKPISTIGQALFNFSQGLGSLEHRYQGSIRLSVSDPFTITQSRNLGASDYVYTQLPSAIRPWTASQIADVNAIAAAFSQIAGISFEPTLSYSNLNPAQVGTNSDINISFVHRSNLGAIAGVSGVFSDFGDIESFKYTGAAGDIVLNSMNLGDLTGATVLSLGSTGSAGFTLLHEIGHSLGMAHPHIAELPNGTRVLSTNFSQTAFVGFQNLGFTLNRIADMDKSYFTIMSYHQTLASGGQAYFAQNPMMSSRSRKRMGLEVGPLDQATTSLRQARKVLLIHTVHISIPAVTIRLIFNTIPLVPICTWAPPSLALLIPLAYR